jgi:hypothetical protein
VVVCIDDRLSFDFTKPADTMSVQHSLTLAAAYSFMCENHTDFGHVRTKEEILHSLCPRVQVQSLYYKRITLQNLNTNIICFTFSDIQGVLNLLQLQYTIQGVPGITCTFSVLKWSTPCNCFR